MNYFYYDCPYCSRRFYTPYTGDRYKCAVILFEGIKAHLQSYSEDDKEYEMDEPWNIEVNQMNEIMIPSVTVPDGDVLYG
jgi:hypothetical protein